MDLNPKWRWTEGLRKERSNYFHIRLSLCGQRSWISLDRWASDNSTKLWWVDSMLTSGDFPLLSWRNKNQAVPFFKCWGANFKKKLSNWWLLSQYMINNKEKYWIHINKADVGGGGQWTFSFISAWSLWKQNTEPLDQLFKTRVTFAINTSGVHTNK